MNVDAFIAQCKKDNIDVEDLKKSDPFYWVWLNSFINENDRVMEFSDHRFLIQPFTDEHPDIVTKKSAQIGWSVMTIFQEGHLAGHKGMNVIHTLPTQNVIKDFVTPKVNPLISKNPEFAKLVKNDSLSLKQFNDRFVYFRGSFKESDAISITADVLNNDEYDRSDQHVLAVYQSRLQASPWAWIRRFSNPSIKGFGVDDLYENSDQQHWFITCNHCNKKQFLIWPDNIDQVNETFICRFCKRELSHEARRDGEWIAKYPKRKRRGYWVSQLMVPYVKASYIIEKSKEDPAFFHNFVLGLAYSEAEMVVNRSSIIRCLAPGTTEVQDLFLGVDNGVVKHWVLGTKEGILRYGKTTDWKDIEDMITRYKCYTVIDANPYPTVPKKLADKFRGKVFINYYMEDTKNFQTIRWGEGKELGIVKSDRTKIIDLVASEINNVEMLFFQTATALDGYIEHWLSMYRGVETNAKQQKKGVWLTKEGKPDHWAHATVYYRIACEKGLGVKGQVVKQAGPKKPKSNPVVNPVDNTIASEIDPAKIARQSGRKQKSWRSV